MLTLLFLCPIICAFGYLQKVVKAGGVDRLTDTKSYTGTHKERFDESGKGKGIAGREDLVTDTGYVTGFKGPEGDQDQQK